MTSRFDHVWLKLDRAKQHVDDLDAAITAFYRSDPYHIITEDDPQTGRRTAKIGPRPDPIPAAVPLILGDAVHAIRVSLDYFMRTAVRVPTDQTVFPVLRQSRVPTARELKTLVDGKVVGASKQLRQALYALQPHFGGHGEYIWLIHHLDLIDKHRLLVTVGIAYRSVILDAAAELRGLPELPWTKDLPVMPLGLRPAQRYPVQEGTPLFTADPDFFAKQKDLKFAFNVAFGEPQVLVGEPVVPTLRRLLDEVESLLKRLIPLV
jgi:hypothetical protein